MGRTKIEVRCDEETRKDFRRVCFEIDQDATYEDIIKLFVEVYDSDPSEVQVRYNDWFV